MLSWAQELIFSEGLKPPALSLDITQLIIYQGDQLIYCKQQEMSSVQNLCWLMIIWGIVRPNKIYWGLFHNPRASDPGVNQPVFHGTRGWDFEHCSSGDLGIETIEAEENWEVTGTINRS